MGAAFKREIYNELCQSDEQIIHLSKVLQGTRTETDNDTSN